MKKKVLITGGMGYIGGRVAANLLEEGHDVVLGGRNAGIPPDWLRQAKVFSMDWTSMENLHSACDGMDTVIHLAAMNDGECSRDPVAALEVNGVNTVRLVEAAKGVGVSRFIYFSTAHIYGSPLAGCIDESTLPHSRHPYASSHRAAEDVVLAAAGHLVPIVLRLSNGFGAPMHRGANCWKLLVNDLCSQAVAKRTMTLRSSGLQKRDFITMRDVAGVVSHMMDLDKTVLGDGIYNVGSGRSMRVLEMAEAIRRRCAEMLGYFPEIVRPEPAGNEVNPDLEYRIGKLLATGYSLNGKLEEEIDSTLRLCQEGPAI